MAGSVGFFTKFWYGFGQMAEGMKNAAFGAFLLLFYSQVLGLPGWLAGIAMFFGLLSDAITDPMAGSISDACRHRWGRRHPFMYASVVPMAITFWLAFRPPQGADNFALFLWMLVFPSLARLALTLYHVPHLALGAELTDDYHDRTSVVAYRLFFGLLGGVALILLCRQVFLVSTPEFPNGELNPHAYPAMGLFFGAVMAIAIFLSALGTHSSIPRLPKPASGIQPFSIARLLGEMRQALRNHSFRYLFLGTLVFFVSRGVDSALSIYMGTFFWRLQTSEVLLVPLFGALGIALGTPFWNVVARRFDKRQLFLAGVCWYSLLTFVLPVLKIVEFYPPRESPLYLGIIYSFVFLAAFGAAAALMTSGSMMADIADEHEYDVGRRQEGIFFGSLSFSGKAAVGLGSGIAGAGLTVIQFPRQVAPELVAPDTVMSLGILAGPGVAILMLIGILLMTRYRLTRERVAEIQAELAQRRRAYAGARA
jgi:GPH family glycoside/pentoside/hexuronide:cation symporter